MKSYIRMYADGNGQSLFEDVTVTYHETEISFSVPLLGSSYEAATQYGFRVVPLGWKRE